ncbi:MAG: molybdopterin-binding protein, partial [Moorella humiferrea]|nr:molybdopterin-binding protein [Moorella humiferrea]
MFQKVRVEESVGTVLAHDLTKIVRGEFKGRRFKKGHIIQAEDIPELLTMGKEHLYVLALGPDEVHEDE